MSRFYHEKFGHTLPVPISRKISKRERSIDVTSLSFDKAETKAIPSSEMMEKARAVLQQTFGFSDFKQGQMEILAGLFQGQNCLAVFPTGTGKSLCFQLPSLLFGGLTLVISPLLAIMKDQVDFLKKKGIAAERLDSTLDRNNYNKVVNALKNGQLKILYVAPGLAALLM